MGSINSTNFISKTVIFPGARKTDLGLFAIEQGLYVNEYCFSKKHLTTTAKIIFGEGDVQQVDYLRISTQESQKKPQRVIFFHGNAENMVESLHLILPIFRKLNITTYVMEYPGYGSYRMVQGLESIPNRIKQDCVQFVEVIKKEQKIKEENIYLIGRSIGTGVASYLSSKINCQKVLLISPFDSIKNMANKMIGYNLLNKFQGLANFTVKDQFDNLESISKFNGKLMIIHGQNDEVINISHGQELYDQFLRTRQNEQIALESKFRRLAEKGHNNIDFNLDDSYLLSDIENFFIQKKQANL